MADAKAAAIDDEADEGTDDASDQPKKSIALKLPPLKFLIAGGAALLLLAGTGPGPMSCSSHKSEAKVEMPARQARGLRRSAGNPRQPLHSGTDRTAVSEDQGRSRTARDQKMIEQIPP